MKAILAAVGFALTAASTTVPAAQPASTPQTAALTAQQQRSNPVALAATIKARQHYFGIENVDARNGRVDDSKVLFSWFSVASFAVAAKGHVFLLDSYIYRLADTPAYVPSTVQELVDLNPEAIFIGHGHGDHSDNAAYIAQLTGARLYGAAEHCDQFQADAVRFFGARANIRCTSITTLGSTPGSEIRQVNALGGDFCITAFKHVHSATVPLDTTIPQNLVNPVRDPRVDQLFPPKPAPAINTTTVAGVGGPIPILYQFTVAGTDFTFVWHDTAGPLKEQAPQILQILANLPKSDVELGAGVSIGEAVNGVRDITTYINQLQPQVFFMTHTDNFNIGASEYYLQAIEREFDIFHIPPGDRPEIRGLHDPYDYLRPGLLTFDPKADAWKDTARHGNRRTASCRG